MSISDLPTARNCLERIDALWEAGDQAAAAAACRQALALDPTYAAALMALGLSLCNARQASPGLTAFARLWRLAPDIPQLDVLFNQAFKISMMEIPLSIHQGRREEAAAAAARLERIEGPFNAESVKIIQQLLASRPKMERFSQALLERCRGLALPQPLERHRIIVLYGGIGDQIAVLGFLAGQYARDGVPYILVGAPNNQAIASMYAGPHVSLTILGELAIEPWGFIQFMDRAPGGVFLPWIPLHYSGEAFENPNGATKVDFYRAVLGVAADEPVAAPTPPADAVARARARFDALGLPPGRTVVLAPHANTIGSLSPEWWAGAARSLQAAGWAVLVNAANNARSFDHHRNRPGSPMAGAGGIEADIPLDEMIPIIERAGYFLGVRSGLCDLAAFARARLLIAYPAERVAGASGGLKPAYGGGDGFESVNRCYAPADCREIAVAVDAAFDPGLLAEWLNLDPA